MAQHRPPLTRDIAAFVHGLRYEAIPERVLEPLRQSVVDTVGCGLLGARTPYGALISEFVGNWDSAGQALIWGTGRKAAAPFAAMANSASCHAWDYDDTLLPAVLHPGSVAIPTAFAIAEQSRKPMTGRAVLTALAAGYEVGNVIGTALGSKSFASGGFYNSVPTIFVAAATAAKLMGLNQERIARALGLAASQAAGLYSATLAKRFNAPKAVLGGIFAADLARMGLEASTDSIEAEYSGFLGTFSRAPDYKAVSRYLGKWRFEIYHKNYPCIRSNHPTVENVKLMMEENPEIKANRISRITSHVDQLTVDYTLKTTSGGASGVKTVGNALISLPYCVAAMAVDGELTLRQFSPGRIKDRRIQALMQRVVLKADRKIDELPATHRYRCRTVIELADGRVFRRALAGPKGDPNNRLTDDEMESKFLQNAAKAMPPRRAQRLFDQLLRLGEARDVRKIIRKLGEG